MVTPGYAYLGRVENGEPFQSCVEGHSAVVEDDKIMSWTRPNTDFQCD